MSYDADETRTLKQIFPDGPDQAATSAVIYAEDLYERTLESGSTSQSHKYIVYAGGEAVAQVTQQEQSGTVTDPEVTYLHGDFLGSAHVLSRADGSVLQQRQFDVFGAPTPASGANGVTIGFTGQEHDADSGLINMKGRLYDPTLGRFITPDPFTPELFWSQGLNRYSYVANNPLNFVDPSGFQGVPGGGGGAGGGDCLTSNQQSCANGNNPLQTFIPSGVPPVDFNGGSDVTVRVTGQRPYSNYTYSSFTTGDIWQGNFTVYIMGWKIPIKAIGAPKNAHPTGVGIFDSGSRSYKDFVRSETSPTRMNGEGGAPAGWGGVEGSGSALGQSSTTDLDRDTVELIAQFAPFGAKIPEGTFRGGARPGRTATDRLVQHTLVKDLVGAAREAKTGIPHGGQHLKEVREAATGLRIRIEQINNGLANPNLSSAQRATLTEELSKASRNLDAAEQAMTGVYPRHGQ